MVNEHRRFGLVLATAVVICASLVLTFGWGLEIDALRRIAPGYPAMVPATALTVLAGGLGTLALHLRRPRWQPIASAAILFCVVLIEQVASLTPRTGRDLDGMSVASIASAVLLGASLTLRAVGWTGVPTVIDTAGFVITTIPMIGYVFGSSTLYEDPFYTQMALHTAICHAILFFTLLLTAPRRGWIAVLLGGEPGCIMARRVLPVAIVMPLILSLLASMAVERNVMTVDFRLAALTFLIIASTVTAVLGFAALSNRTERHSTEVEAAYLRSERQRQELELAAVRSEKIAALGKLVGGIAHDFNNTLNVILGNLELLREDPDERTHEGYVDEAIKASNRAAALTRQLLAYGRKSQLRPVPLAVEEEVGSALAMFRRVCPANIAILSNFAEDRARVKLDPEAFQQAVLNVLINARDALPEGGTIRIVTRTERLDAAAVTGFHESEILPAGLYVTVRFEDDGLGMPPEIVARATEPFFTSKGVGEGTGLGLSTVAGFCRQSDGGLRIDSAVNSGTTITMAFPASAEPIDAASEEVAPLTPQKRRGIFVVDDDIALARLMVTQLELDGHFVRLAHDATDALAAIEAGPVPEVVLTDIVMPGEIQGHNLAVRIRQRFPGTRVILMSGYTTAAQRREITALVDLPFLQKPIDLRTLRTVVGGAATNDADTSQLP